MPELYVLTADDIALLRDLIARERQRPSNARNRPAVIEPDPQAPEVYVALAPVGGVPGVGVVGTGTGSGAEDVPGSASCEVYRVINGVLFPVSGLYRTVYNLWSAVGAGSWVLLARDKFGSWLVAERPAAGATSTFDGAIGTCTASFSGNGASTTLVLDTTTDTSAYFDAGLDDTVFTAPHDGVYDVRFSAGISSNSGTPAPTHFHAELVLLYNLATEDVDETTLNMPASSSFALTLRVARLVKAFAGDTFHADVGWENISGSSTATVSGYCSIEYMGPLP